MTVLDDPDQLPRKRGLVDVDAIPGDAVISIRVWAALQPNPRDGNRRGVAVGTVNRNRTRSVRRRKDGKPRRGDMPPEDLTLDASAGPHARSTSPGWFMRTYREWEATRPGMDSAPGHPAGVPRPAIRRRFQPPFEVTLDDGQVVTVTEEMVRGGPVRELHSGPVVVRVPFEVELPTIGVVTVTEEWVKARRVQELPPERTTVT